MIMPCDDDVPNAGDDAAKPDALRVPRWYLVPAGDDGQPVMARKVPIHAAEDLNIYLAPVEPFYTVNTAAAMLCMTKVALNTFLTRHKQEYPAVYRRTVIATGTQKIRLLPASDVRRIASTLIKSKLTRKNKPGARRDHDHTVIDPHRHGDHHDLHVVPEAPLAQVDTVM